MEANQGLFLLHLLQFPRRYQSRMMRRLAGKGYTDLRLSYSPVIAELARGRLRPTELAARLGMQKQNCVQLVRRIESAGYIERVADPQDGRSRLLGLTGRGATLVRDGVSVVAELDAQLSAVAGLDAFNAFVGALQRLQQAVCTQTADIRDTPPLGALINALIQLAGHAGTELNALVRARGYPEIRPAHEQVLLHLGEGRVRMQDIARENDVSRQAVSALVNELQSLGFIRLDVDPRDARGRIIRLTEQGNTLVACSAEVGQAFLQQYIAVVGTAGLNDMASTLAALYAHLAAPSDTAPAAGAGRALDVVRFVLAHFGVSDEQAVALLNSGTHDRAGLYARLNRDVGEDAVADFEKLLARLR